MTQQTIIAIDGPAGSGKSTLARALASRLGLATLDTGATYRAVAAAALSEGIAPEDVEAVAAFVRSSTLTIEDRIVIDGRDVTDEIRSESVNTAVSLVAANPDVRSILVAWQRAWVAAHGGAVVEGRDIGTVVFPDATAKLYLTASADERARRRSEEGLAGIERRDRIDSTRKTSPLTQAQDAWVIDTTDSSVEDVVAMVLERINAGGSRNA